MNSGISRHIGERSLKSVLFRETEIERASERERNIERASERERESERVRVCVCV